ncbi:enoyl-CoA hydratase [Ovoidimarina sediminis]|uniref:enoyl-CoA hydratase n=1 Tax=Ovoidimarina sediminis TaxID=3079856 RepID=UPI0029064985|nr:enoyl-CoA hydratase [Rhodophyticola sp. MJ-SS7]MDU8945246.1 enoyl-CoA hydratase [Rhodophyticola sp. MJ-SS7]
MSEEKLFDDGRILLRRSGDVGTVVFNHPQRLNAMRLSMWQALSQAVAELSDMPGLRAAVFQGTGGHAFVAGADISEFKDVRSGRDAVEAYDDAVEAAETAIAALTVPTIAAIRGYCIGGGLGIAVRCDIRLATTSAEFALTPARLGIGYRPAGVKALLRCVSPSVAADLLFSARSLSAAEALEAGLVNRVFRDEDFEKGSSSYISRIAANAPLSVRAAKAALQELVRPVEEQDLTRVEALINACFESEDYSEGHTAFLEKRKPRFTGQ